MDRIGMWRRVLLVAAVALGVYLVIGLGRYALARQEVAACRWNLNVVRFALDAYASEQASFPADLALLKSRYMTLECFDEVIPGPHGSGQPYVLHKHAASLPTNRVAPLCWDARPHAVPHPLLIWRKQLFWNVFEIGGGARTCTQREMAEMGI